MAMPCSVFSSGTSGGSASAAMRKRPGARYSSHTAAVLLREGGVCPGRQVESLRCGIVFGFDGLAGFVFDGVDGDVVGGEEFGHGQVPGGPCLGRDGQFEPVAWFQEVVVDGNHLG